MNICNKFPQAYGQMWCEQPLETRLIVIAEKHLYNELNQENINNLI